MNERTDIKKAKTECIVFENIRDFDLEHVFECGQCFRWVPIDDVNGGGSADYIGAAGSYAARISYRISPNGISTNSISSGSNHVNGIETIESSGFNRDRDISGTLTIEATGGDEEFWRRYFDLDTDYAAVKQTLKANDPAIEPATDYGRGIRILNQDLFETIISFIISQNNNIPRIRKNIESICEKYGEHIGEVFGREWYAFPTPEALAGADVDDLMALRLGYRAPYIKATAQSFLEGECPACREDVLAYHGVGPKVANCIMLFGLHDTAAFPIDTWVRHIMNDMYGFDEKDMKGMQQFAADKFGNLAGYAQQYLFYYYRDKKI
jgi:N-glycosylase/DNA lyase